VVATDDPLGAIGTAVRNGEKCGLRRVFLLLLGILLLRLYDFERRLV
jgi:hypothetical protein